MYLSQKDQEDNMLSLSGLVVVISALCLLLFFCITLIEDDEFINDGYGDYSVAALPMVIGLYFIGTGEISHSIFLWLFGLTLFVGYNWAVNNLTDNSVIKFYFTDVIAAFSIWFVFDLRLISREHRVSFNIDWILISIVSGLFVVQMFRSTRAIPNLFRFYLVWKRDLGLSGLAILVLLATVLPVGYWFGMVVPHQVTASSIAMFQGRLLLSFVSVAFVEEVIFRGVVQDWFAHKFNKWVGLTVASVAFGLCHLYKNVGSIGIPNWRYAILATLAGSVYGYLYKRTGSLLTPMFVHAFTDATWNTFLRP